jgi:Z1 domain
MVNACTLTEVQINEAVRFLAHGIDVLGINPQVLLNSYPMDCQDILWQRYQDRTIIVSPPKGPTIIDKKKPSWNHKFNSANGQLWAQLHEHLIVDKGRSELEVASLDQASDEILFRLNDPFTSADTKSIEPVKGLVVGYVQSGKTANYTALAAKAFDAGFKIVIVLTGIHNALRRQTQIRMNNELGVAISRSERVTAAKAGEPTIHAMTTEDLLTGDFKYSNIANSVLNSGRFLFVTKKNKSVLQNLNRWLGQNLGQQTLIIDDEADQASINTGGNRIFDMFETESPALLPEPNLGELSPDEISPTAINKEIRILIDKFSHVSYVGYTATPYANVFIRHDAQDREAGDDLYPSDFIVSLEKPVGYMGPEEFFGSSVTDQIGDDPSVSDSVIQIVPDEEITELKDLIEHHAHNPDIGIPKSMQTAIKEFLLGTSIRRAVEIESKPSAILIHTTRLADDQSVLKSKVEDFLKTTRMSWRYNPEGALREWKAFWDQYVATIPDGPFKITFDDVIPKLSDLISQFSPLPVLLLNSKSDDELDYELNPNLTAIVIGGNKLSRGLTIEGLIVSYFVRESSSPNADTLTQMGRFFGYKSDVVDITRIYTTDQLRSEFRDVSLMESSLRREIQLYALSGKSPDDFGPRVIKRVGLLPTARNRMRDARSYDVSYSGDLVQTTSFPKYSELNGAKNKTKLLTNVELTSAFLSKCHQQFLSEDLGLESKMLWKGVNSNDVAAFIEQYQVVDNATRFRPELLSRYIRDMQKEGELTEFSVALVGRSADSTLGSESFGLSRSVGKVARSLAIGSDVSIGSLITPLHFAGKTGDELIDLTDSQLEEASMLIGDFGLTPVNAVRTVRTPKVGLLLVYPISQNSRGSESSKGKRVDVSLGESLKIPVSEDLTIVGLSLVFPNSDQDQTSRKYWVGTAGQDDER